MAKRLLKAEWDYSYRCIGISSSTKDYRICHYLNKVLQFRFEALGELSVQIKEGEKGFSAQLFSYKTENNIARYFFINNKNDNEILLKKLKEIDFFLFVEGEILDSEWLELQASLKKIDVIQHFSELDNKHFKGIEHYIFES